jgi:hypothetical protein
LVTGKAFNQVVLLPDEADALLQRPQLRSVQAGDILAVQDHAAFGGAL